MTTTSSTASADLPDLTDPVALTQALIRFPSVTPEDAGALEFVTATAEALGFRCHRMTFSDTGSPPIDNVYARLGDGGPNLCFAGHTDVVPAGDAERWSHPPFGADIENGVVFGRGAVDMKGAIACFLAAVARVRGSGAQASLSRGSLSLLITGDEEGPAINGTQKVLGWLKERGERLDACLVGEPSNPSRIGEEIKIGRRGSINGELIVHGVQGHSAYPQRADNPLPKLARVMDRLSRHRLDEGSRHFEPSTLTFTIVEVPNTATNVIPAFARAVFNVRYNDQWSRDAIVGHIHAKCDEALQDICANYDLSFEGSGGAFLTKPGHLVETLVAAIRGRTGMDPSLSTGGGTSDARFIKDVCAVVEFGLVNDTIHSVDERVSVADLELLTTIYQDFIVGFMSESQGKT